LSYGKPFVASRKMADIASNETFIQSLKKSEISLRSVFFPLSPTGFEQMLNTLKSTNMLLQLGVLSCALADASSIEKSGGRTYNQKYEPNSEVEFHPNIRTQAASSG